MKLVSCIIVDNYLELKFYCKIKGKNRLLYNQKTIKHLVSQAVVYSQGVCFTKATLAQFQHVDCMIVRIQKRCYRAEMFY